jgi:hypothetical protein
MGAVGLVLAVGGFWSAFAMTVLRCAPGVRELRCKDPQAGYRFRCDGLKLLPQSGDQYLLLPQNWSRNNGVAILIPRNDRLRLELVPASARGTARASTC